MARRAANRSRDARKARRQAARDKAAGTGRAPMKPRAIATLPPVFLDGSGRTVPDPHAVLGLPPETTDSETIRQAWLEGLRAHPPEANPERAEALRAARDRLLSPDRVIERQLGRIDLPDPEALGLGTPEAPRVSGLDRALAQLVLHAIAEAELGRTPDPGRQPGLFDS